MRIAAACLSLLLAGAAVAQEGAAPEPFALTYTRDDSRAVSKLIQAETGGTISVTNAAGDRIKLKIAPDTLYYDETITLTPLDGTTGIDGAERMIAVAMEPAGVAFTSPASLTITPKDKLAGDIWWFESPKGADGATAQPALPLKGQSGMMVWHFSTGAVASGGPAISQSVRARAPGELSPLSERVSVEWLDWRRNQAEQDYQAGRIDKAKRDSDLALIQDLLEQLAAEAAAAKAAEINKKLEDGLEEASDTAAVAEKVAESGDPADLDFLTGMMIEIAAAERQAQLLGRPESATAKRMNGIMQRYADGFASRCEKRRDMGRETAEFVLGLERMLELNGQSSEDVSSGLVNCLNREWSAGPVEDNTYGRTTVTITKSGCAQGVWGGYTYDSVGAITGSFTFEAKPPKDNFVTFTPVTLRATLKPEWATESYTCTQSGEVSIGEPPGAFFKSTGPFGECLKSDDFGSVSIIYNVAIPLKGGPLCK